MALKVPGANVIADFVAQLEDLIDANHDDAHDLASWVAALATVQASVQRKLADMMIAREHHVLSEREMRQAYYATCLALGMGADRPPDMSEAVLITTRDKLRAGLDKREDEEAAT